jgi:protein-tyrosine phosphatase
MTIRICFVCLGNICRSPTAEAMMQHLLEEAALTEQVEIDSAGTGAWHVGEPPDTRAQAAGKRRGIAMRGKARKVITADFQHFDYLIAMDRSNRDDLLALASSTSAREKVVLLRDFDPQSPPEAEVPDPYYGDGDGFERVLDICEAACRGLLDHLRAHHRL